MADIKYTITVDEKGAVTSIKRLDEEVEKLGKGAGTAGKESHFLTQKITGIIPAFTAASIAADLIRGSYRFLKNEVRETIDAAIESERVNKSLDAALEITGRGAAKLGEHYKDNAEALMKVTIYDDEAIKKTQALLIQLTNLDRDGIDKATRGTIGLSSALGIDLNSAATMVAKAMEGNFQGLQRYGIKVREDLPLEQKRAELLGILEKMFGRATAETQTFGGQLSQLKNRWGEVQEAAGGFITSQAGIIDLLNKASQAVLDYLTMDEMLAKATGRQVEQENRLADRLGKAAVAANWKYGEMAKLIAAYGGITPALIAAITHEKHGTEIKEAYVKVLREERLEWEKNAAARKKAEQGTNGLTTATEKLVETTLAMPWGRHRAEYYALLNWIYPIVEVVESVPPKINKLSKQYQFLVREAQRIADTNPWDKLSEKVSAYAQKFNEVFSSLNTSFSQAQTNREIAIENEYKKRLAVIEATVKDEDAKQKAIMALEAESEIKRTSAKRAAAKQQKAIAMMEAVVNTRDAVTKALAQGGFLLGIPWAAIVGALGAIQIGMIAAQPIPLARGAYFDKPTLMPGRDGNTYLGGEEAPEIMSPVPVMRQIVRDEVRALIPAMTGGGSFILNGGIHIHTEGQVDGALIFSQLKSQARLHGFKVRR